MDKKRENFKRISENRVSKVIEILEQLQNLKNTSFYSYTDEDIEKIYNAILYELEDTKTVLINANKKSKRFKL